MGPNSHSANKLYLCIYLCFLVLWTNSGHLPFAQVPSNILSDTSLNDGDFIKVLIIMLCVLYNKPLYWTLPLMCGVFFYLRNFCSRWRVPFDCDECLKKCIRQTASLMTIDHTPPTYLCKLGDEAQRSQLVYNKQRDNWHFGFLTLFYLGKEKLTVFFQGIKLLTFTLCKKYYAFYDPTDHLHCQVGISGVLQCVVFY